jgi:CRISPR/Cas system-associated endoribonuclease Cas2
MAIKRGESVKKILEGLMTAGEIVLLAMEPRVNLTMSDALSRYDKYKSKQAKERATEEEERKFRNAFYYLKKNRLINVEYRGNQMYFSLTESGKKKAGKYKINDLKIKAAKKWDKKWRVLIFDIEDRHRTKREALRGKIKELGLYQLQKSVWVCPYEFKKEMKILRDFFGLNTKEMKVIAASEIEDDKPIRQFFNLN